MKYKQVVKRHEEERQTGNTDITIGKQSRQRHRQVEGNRQVLTDHPNETAVTSRTCSPLASVQH